MNRLMDIKNAGISTIRILFTGAPRVHIPIKCIYLTATYIQLHAEVVFKNLLDNTVMKRLEEYGKTTFNK